MKKRHSVVIAAHSHLGFEGIASLINEHPNYSIASYEDQKPKLLETLRQSNADVLLMCYRFGNSATNPTIKEIRQALPNISIVIVSAQPRDFEAVTQLYEAGASAFLCSTTADQNALFNALEHATNGNSYYTNSYKDKLIESTVVAKSAVSGNSHAGPEAIAPNLGAREKQVLGLIAQGYSAKEVARALDISKNTVEVHRRNIMIKLGLRKSTELTRYAIENKLVEL